MLGYTGQKINWKYRQYSD